MQWASIGTLIGTETVLVLVVLVVMTDMISNVVKTEMAVKWFPNAEGPA